MNGVFLFCCFFLDSKKQHPLASITNYFTSVSLHKPITSNLPAAVCPHVPKFNLPRYQIFSVDKNSQSIKNVLPPLQLAEFVFNDGVKLFEPQLGESNFPGVHLFSPLLLFIPPLFAIGFTLSMAPLASKWNK